MSVFIMPPLALAADVQLCVLKTGVQGIGLDMYYKICRSMEVICRAMDAFKDLTGEHDACIQHCKAFLESIQNGRWVST